MYHAIVFLPLLGAIIATLITLAGARARFPGGSPDAGAEGHGHAPVDESHARAAPAPHGPHAVSMHPMASRKRRSRRPRARVPPSS